MNGNTNQKEVLARLARWGEAEPLVRAMLLTSTRAVPGAQPDLFSDYDVILVLSDARPFHASRDWLAAFGRVLALYRDPLEEKDGGLHAGYVIQFEDGLKIDFSLWEPGVLREIIAQPALPPEFDAGYQVLLDKDGLTAGLQPPTYRGYIPRPPTAERYRETVENFLLDTTYFAKYLWRDDLMAARYIMDSMLRHEHLLPMLEWHGEIEHGWSVSPGPYGRRLKRWLRLDLWQALESTYTGPGVVENWAALDRMIALFQQAAEEVGQALGYAYPADMHARTMAYLEKVRALAKEKGQA